MDRRERDGAATIETWYGWVQEESRRKWQQRRRHGPRRTGSTTPLPPFTPPRHLRIVLSVCMALGKRLISPIAGVPPSFLGRPCVSLSLRRAVHHVGVLVFIPGVAFATRGGPLTLHKPHAKRRERQDALVCLGRPPSPPPSQTMQGAPSSHATCSLRLLIPGYWGGKPINPEELPARYEYAIQVQKKNREQLQELLSA